MKAYLRTNPENTIAVVGIKNDQGKVVRVEVFTKKSDPWYWPYGQWDAYEHFKYLANRGRVY